MLYYKFVNVDCPIFSTRMLQYMYCGWQINKLHKSPYICCSSTSDIRCRNCIIEQQTTINSSYILQLRYRQPVPLYSVETNHMMHLTKECWIIICWAQYDTKIHPTGSTGKQSSVYTHIWLYQIKTITTHHISHRKLCKYLFNISLW